MVLKVQVVKALPRDAAVISLELAPGATVGDALRAAGIAHQGRVGIFGAKVTLEARLADGDRIELYRPLEVDPKEARRRRARRSGR